MEVTDEKHAKSFWRTHEDTFLPESDFNLMTSPPKPLRKDWKTFKIDIQNDGDFLPQIVDLKEKSGESAFPGGCFRNTMNGGGSSPAMFRAFRYLRQIIRRDMQDISVGQFVFKYGFKHSEKPFVKRHMDDGCGDFGMYILADGKVCIVIRPAKARGNSKDAHILIPPNTWYQRTYTNLMVLYEAIEEDNRVRGAFRGCHTY